MARRITYNAGEQYGRPNYEFPGPCTSPPSDTNYKIIVFEANNAVLLTCNKEIGVFLDVPNPSDNSYGQIVFANFLCQGNKWVNQDLFYTSKYLRCTKGCSQIAKNEYLHATSSPETCLLLNDPNDTINPPSYIKCELTCKTGYYPVSSAENQLSSQNVYCKYQFEVAYWDIKTGFNLNTFVSCFPGCYAYGSFKNEDIYGMAGNFKTVGKIDNIPRYINGELQCDELNGFFANSGEFKKSIVFSCISGSHWEPIKPNYYCIKGCQKPGGEFGVPPITGYIFTCSEGSSGWYLQCSFSCNGEAGYTMVGRSNLLPNGPMSEIINCTDGDFDMTLTQNTCEVICYPPTKVCDTGYTCTGVVYAHDGSDTGKRYCVEVIPGTSTVQIVTEQFKSQVSAFMIDVFGSYDWLV